MNHDELQAWLDFRRTERASHNPIHCTECHCEIPTTDDVIEWVDGSGRICAACALANEAN